MSEESAAERDAFVRFVLRAGSGRVLDEADVATWSKRLEKGLSPYEMVASLAAIPKRAEFLQGAPLAFPAGHFYSAITDPVLVAAHLERVKPNGAPMPGVRVNGAAMLELWQSFEAYLERQPYPDEREEGTRYWFRNPAFSYGDGTVLHCMLRRFQPRRIVEVGSGYSSACALDTAERFLPQDTSLTFIEPHPRLLNELLVGEPPRREVEILPVPVQDAPLELFTELQAGDVLFIDSTHVLKTGSDVAFELFEILPRLQSGVLVHFHDIGWPFEYSRKWAVDENRSWNEIYALRAFLTFNKAFDIVFFNDFFRRVHRAEVERVAPWFLNNGGASIWLQRR